MTKCFTFLNKIAIEIASDCALIVTVCDAEKNIIDANAFICALTDAMLHERPLWLREFIPSYNTLLVEYDLFSSDHLMVASYLKRLVNSLVLDYKSKKDSLESDFGNKKSSHANTHRVPVCYELNDCESDLHLLSQTKNMSIDEIIKIHCGASYQVFATGFLPGFAYLGELPAILSQARLSQPRLKVPAGAVAIADRQTAIYPCETPGGWHILGYTPLSLLNPKNNEETLLQTGDQVEFYSISADEYEKWKPTWK